VGRPQAPEACRIWGLGKLRVVATEPVRTGQPEFVIGIERCGSGPSSGAVRSATPPAYPDQGRRAFGLHGNGSSGPAAELLRYGASLATSNSKKPRKLFAPRLLHYIAEAEGLPS
jgi:hypothetical protein